MSERVKEIVQKEEVKYSLEFLNKLNSLLPDDLELKKEILLLANNNEFKVGRLLDDLTDEKINAIEIVKSFEEGDLHLHNLFTKAKRLANNEELWNMWMSEIENESTRT